MYTGRTSPTLNNNQTQEPLITPQEWTPPEAVSTVQHNRLGGQQKDGKPTVNIAREKISPSVTQQPCSPTFEPTGYQSQTFAEFMTEFPKRAEKACYEKINFDRILPGLQEAIRKDCRSDFDSIVIKTYYTRWLHNPALTTEQLNVIFDEMIHFYNHVKLCKENPDQINFTKLSIDALNSLVYAESFKETSLYPKLTDILKNKYINDPKRGENVFGWDYLKHEIFSQLVASKTVTKDDLKGLLQHMELCTIAVEVQDTLLNAKLLTEEEFIALAVEVFQDQEDQRMKNSLGRSGALRAIETSDWSPHENSEQKSYIADGGLLHALEPLAKICAQDESLKNRIRKILIICDRIIGNTLRVSSFDEHIARSSIHEEENSSCSADDPVEDSEELLASQHDEPRPEGRGVSWKGLNYPALMDQVPSNPDQQSPLLPKKTKSPEICPCSLV